MSSPVLDRELKKGSAELLVLSLVEDRPRHGYEIGQLIERRSRDDPRVRPGMTANVKIPVGNAENVVAVPLAAVFTEKNPDNDKMERFVYVQRDESYEKKNVKVGLCDYFYAEIRDGIAEGDVVALELPKEEREKKPQTTAHRKSGGSKKVADVGKNRTAQSIEDPSTNNTSIAASTSSAGTNTEAASGTGGAGGGEAKNNLPTVR